MWFFLQVGSSKISAVGVSVSRWVTFHGIALNIDCDMNNFKGIVPCGITEPGTSVSSIQELTGHDFDIKKNDVVAAIKSSFQDVFGVELIPKADAYTSLKNVVKSNPLPKDVTDNLVKLK